MTHQRGPSAVLRSKSPELVIQEIWGHPCCHFAICTLKTDTAIHTGHEPDSTSFVAALRISRQTVAHRGSLPLKNARGTTGRQTQDAQMARRTRPPRRLAPTPTTEHRHNRPPSLNGIATSRGHAGHAVRGQAHCPQLSERRV